MVRKILMYKYKILFSILIIVGFGLIRNFEKQWFYDPFLDYFKSDFVNFPYPEFVSFKLFLSLLFRFILNTGLSLLLIFILFHDREIVEFSALLYGIFGIVLFVLFFSIIWYYPDGEWLLFYVRRFIIQPILVLIFIPAFYYQLQSGKK
jgi:exosortase F-associated protein